MSTFHRSAVTISKALFSSNSRRFKPPNVKYINKKESSLMHTSVPRNIDENSSKGMNDPELQQIIKEMHKDFHIDSNTNNLMDEEGVNNFTGATSTTTEDHQEKIKADVLHKKSYSDVEFSTDIIYDYDEERLLKEKGLWEEKAKNRQRRPEINYERGKNGVFDVDELVFFLREQRARDVVAIQIPPEAKFVDYLVISTAKSRNHINVLAEYLYKVYKRKKHARDRFAKIEGKGSNWVAIDMGNLALHIMTEDLREEKDIDTLWTVGAEHDQHCLEWENPFPIDELLRHPEGQKDKGNAL